MRLIVGEEDDDDAENGKEVRAGAVDSTKG